MIGVFITVTFIYLYLLENQTCKKPWIFQVFNTPIALKLGLFSYSIYLIHSPFLALFNLLSLDLSMPMSFQWMLMEGLVVPAILLISYGFYLLVEKRFVKAISNPKRRRHLYPN